MTWLIFFLSSEKTLEIADHTLLPGGVKFSSYHIPRGVLEIDGATLVLFENAMDNLRSMCNICLVVPWQHLRMRLPGLMVGVLRIDATQWNRPDNNERPEPSLLDFKCLFLDQVLVPLGP